MRWRLTWLFALLVLTPAAARADVKTHALCSDGMVLQQKAKVNIWGTADPGEQVTIDFLGKTASAAADDKGNWLVSLDSGAAGGPHAMTITGKNKLEYRNVLVGEVWVCSGQSNMEWWVDISGAEDKKIAKTEPHNPLIRVFKVQKRPSAEPQADVAPREGKKITNAWVEASPETAGDFSAVGFFFGRKLHRDLKVPVGMIDSSWGGTRAEAWTRKEALETNPTLKEREAPRYAKPEVYKKDANAPSALYNGMIAPLHNYTIRGAIWYQGESNEDKAYEYRTLFPMMIENWRRDWKLGEFPFFFVQLAPFRAVTAPGESKWAELRESQLLTLKLGNTGMAVITDLGSEHDIHPTPKHPVGERLARIALARVYGEKIEYSGPTLKDAKFEGPRVVLTFGHVGGGLSAKELVQTNEGKGKNAGKFEYRVKEGTGSAPLVGFTVCGKDKVFHAAKAEIMDRDTVVVTCDMVPEPFALRYGWADHPVCNLFNSEGLPASPFRTDTFAGVTTPKQ